MSEITRSEIQRVHDLVRTSLGTVEWIVATAADDSGTPPSRLLVKGLLESVLDDPGESPLIGELFTSVADTREDVGLPAGLPSPNWHTVAGEIVARVSSSILTPGGKVSGILGRATAIERTVIRPEKLAQWWPDIAAQLQPFVTIRFARITDLLIQEFSRGMAAFARSTHEWSNDPKIRLQTRERRSDCDIDGGASTGGDSRKSKRGPTANVLMVEFMMKNPHSRGWTVKQWSRAIGKAASTIVETAVWKELAEFRALLKVGKRKDRRQR
tara:strand:- start:50288 stop:51097 length:810 start_codon:yes stop_codon:yes gene_type:complete